MEQTDTPQRLTEQQAKIAAKIIELRDMAVSDDLYIQVTVANRDDGWTLSTTLDNEVKFSLNRIV